MALWCSGCHYCTTSLWLCGVVVITTAQFHSTKSELSFCTGSNLACGVLQVHDGEDLWQWSQLEIRLNAFFQSTIPQKQFIIIIITVSMQKISSIHTLILKIQQIWGSYELNKWLHSFFTTASAANIIPLLVTMNKKKTDKLNFQQLQ